MTQNKLLTKKRICGDCPQCITDSEFSCFWEVEDIIPEKFKPSEIKAYISIENINGIGFLKATEMGQTFDTEFLSWFIAFCVGKGINCFWITKEVPFCLGSPQFVEIAINASKAKMI